MSNSGSQGEACRVSVPWQQSQNAVYAATLGCFAQVLLRKTGCCATPRLAGKTTHSVPIVAAETLTPNIRDEVCMVI